MTVRKAVRRRRRRPKEQQPHKVVVEVVTPEVVSRLDAENQALRKELTQLKGQHGKLHETVYLLMEKVTDLKRGTNKR